jgi:hypothetical protein
MSATDAADMSDIPVGPINRPKIAIRIFAGAAVVLAALAPIAALVFVILHLFHVLPFGQLA